MSDETVPFQQIIWLIEHELQRLPARKDIEVPEKMAREGRHFELLTILTMELGKVADSVNDTHGKSGSLYDEELFDALLRMGAVLLSWLSGIDLPEER